MHQAIACALVATLALAYITTEIVTGMTDCYSYHYRDRQHQNQPGNADRGRFQGRHPRGSGVRAAAAGPLAMAGVNAVAGGEERACYNAAAATTQAAVAIQDLAEALIHSR